MLYAAYGSNINLEQMAWRCPHSKVVGVGMIKGWKLCFNIHADIRKTYELSDTVPVLLWDIAEEDWKKLDIYEGFPKYYITVTVPVYWYDDEEECHTEKAIVYIMSKSRIKSYAFPEKDYFNIIQEGYYENGMDLEYLHQAIEYTSRMMENEYFYS